MFVNRRLIFAVSVFLVGVSASIGGAFAQPASEPGAGLSPVDVVRSQLRGLQSNDENNGGIAIAFNFASPGNRQMTGPLSRFAAMLSQAYPELLNHRSARILKQQVEADEATIAVLIESKDRAFYNYVFRLTRQTAAQTNDLCAGCWMTDGVFRESAGQSI